MLPGKAIRSGYLGVAAIWLLAIAIPVNAETRPSDLSGASRAQYARVLHDRDAIATELKLSRRTVNVITAVVLGKNGSFSDRQLIAAVRDQAKTARRLLDENVELRKQVGHLQDPAVRDPAIAALQRAKTAINEGRFTDAEREYAIVRQIRWDQVGDGVTAWKRAVDGQAGAAFLAGDYDRAEELRLSAGREMRSRLDAEGKQAQLDQIIAAANQRLTEGEVFGRNSALDKAIDLLLNQALPIAGDGRLQMASVQFNLGNALLTKGTRSQGQTGIDTIARARRAYETALDVFTEAENPVEWANAQIGLGNVYLMLQDRAEGTQRVQLSRDAALAYDAALRVFTMAKTPYQWARAQASLGAALTGQGIAASGAEQAKLFSKADLALHRALEVYTEAQFPNDWAHTQIDLARLFHSRAISSGGTMEMLDKSAAAYESALRVYTEAESPMKYANAQGGLGAALTMRGIGAGRKACVDILVRAATADASAIRVYSKIDAPIEWARAQSAAGYLFYVMASCVDGRRRLVMLQKAKVAYEAALDRFTKTKMEKDIIFVRHQLDRLQRYIDETKSRVGDQ